MFWLHFNIVFLGGGGEGGVSWVNRALERGILKLNIHHAFFLTFLSKIVAFFWIKLITLKVGGQKEITPVRDSNVLVVKLMTSGLW